MNGTEIENRLGVTVAKLELAKRDALEVFEQMYPGFISDQTRSEWLRKLMGAYIATQVANHQIEAVRDIILPNGPRMSDATAQRTAETASHGEPKIKVLLEALRTICDAMDPTLTPDPRPLDDLLRFGRQAIAEAEGKTNA